MPPPPPSSSSPSSRKVEPTPTVEEGHEKLCDGFLSKLLEQVPIFIKNVEETLWQNYHLDVSVYEADHVCWRTETIKEYSQLVNALKAASDDECTLLIESNIGGRPIATFSFPKGIDAGDRTIRAVEIPAPKEGSPYKRGLEHVEFVIVTSPEDQPDSPRNDATHQSLLDLFMKKAPSIKWDTRAKQKEINPDVSLKFQLEQFGKCSAKFHLMPLADVIEYEKNLMHNEGLI